ncbi:MULTISPECIES: restriction endonuclease subunit S [unclassified Avibacterium]|uniref:restriction endonuclease subunit S n=1 Tax=unclassified Avibacterium TaxID=2685287 RepID=UPI0021845788|nr:restriction endonuclease subunit S [Avibacterium sp. 20-129]MCW9698502.1 restriction endonuclease subunit S [Avibacterium sp. 20-129]URL02610.1 restriction endonuclease subunit S [Avibacterium sp. 20-126]
MNMKNTDTLSNVIEIIGGGTPKRSEPSYWKGNIPWLSVADFNNDLRFVSDTAEKITELGLKNSSTKLLKKGQIIISARGTVGCLAQLSKDMAFNQSCYGLNGISGIIDNDFLYYFLKNNINELKQKTHGSVFDTITRATFDQIDISYPSILEQKKISAILGNLDKKIALNTQTNQTLEAIAQAIFKHWFIDFAPVHAKVEVLAAGGSAEDAELAAMACLSGKTEEKITALKTQDPTTYHQLQQITAAFPSEFVETEMREVPRGWECLKIEQIIKKIPVGKKYSQKNTFPEGHIPVLDQGKSGIIGFHNNAAGIKASIQDPVIVFANHTCYMRLIHFDFSAIQNVFAFKGQDVNIYWLYLATLGKQRFVEYKGHFPDFLIKQIVVPPKELTEIFGNIVKNSFSKIALNLNTNEKLANARDLLLPGLLSGEIKL